MATPDAEVPLGPLAVRWHGLELGEVRAGAPHVASVSVENAGSVAWQPRPHGEGLHLAYHWLDELGNAIVWDGWRTPLPRPIHPGERATVELVVRGPLPPGHYRLAVDLVEEGRFWLAELGNTPHERAVEALQRIERRLAARGGDPAALARQEEPLVPEEEAEAVAYLADGVAPAPDWSRRVLDAHQEGHGAVAGSIDARGGLLRRQRRELEPYVPGGGRQPGFSHPLVCPSLVRGAEGDWIEPVAGLPSFRASEAEPWLYDARIGVRLST